VTEFIWAGEDRLSDVLSLWRQGFPDDSEEDIREFWYTLKAEARCLMLSVDNEACSMAFVIPAKMNGAVVWYVYAAVTARAYRGRGYFAALLEEIARRAEAENVSGLFLRPAAPSLFTYYARLGFVPLFYREEVKCEADELYTCGYELKWESVTDDVAEQRNRWLAMLGIPSVTWSEAVTAYAQSLLEDGGVLVSDKGLVMYRRDGDGIEITELLCATKDADDVLSSLSRYFACRIKCVCLPPVTTDNAKTYGMFRATGATEVPHGTWYMGFSLE